MPEETMKPDRVYFGGGLFTEQEKAWNQRIADRLEEVGFDLFLPQRDGFEAAELSDKTADEKTDLIFTKDYGEVCLAGVLLANLNGQVPDDGLCVELGIAKRDQAENPTKKIVGYRSDTRTWMGDLELNPLVNGTVDVLFHNEDDLLAFMDELADELGVRLRRSWD